MSGSNRICIVAVDTTSRLNRPAMRLPINHGMSNNSSRALQRSAPNHSVGYPLSMALHAELHRHLGGAIVPRVFWRYLVRHDHPLAAQYPNYDDFETFITRPRSSLT